METNRLIPVASADVLERLKHEFLSSFHYTRLIRRDYQGLNPDGTIGILYLADAIPRHLHEVANDFLREAITGSPRQRGPVVAGKGSLIPQIKADGTLSEWHAVPDKVLAAAGDPRSDLAGFYDYPSGCRETTWTASNREVFDSTLRPFFQYITDLYRAAAPREYRTQLAAMASFPRDSRITNIATTVTMNLNLRTTAHRDQGDLPSGRACMATGGIFQGWPIVESQPEFGEDQRPPETC